MDPRTLVFGGRPYSFRNLLSASYWGSEGTVKYRWGKGSRLILSYARQHAGCAVTGTLTQPRFLPLLQTYANTCSLTAPLDSGSILVAQEFGDGIQFSAGYYQQGRVQVLAAQQVQPMMRRLDLRLAKSFGKSQQSQGGEIELVLQNALQDNATDFSAVPQTNSALLFNRRAYLTATFDF